MASFYPLASRCAIVFARPHTQMMDGLRVNAGAGAAPRSKPLGPRSIRSREINIDTNYWRICRLSPALHELNLTTSLPLVVSILRDDDGCWRIVSGVRH